MSKRPADRVEVHQNSSIQFVFNRKRRDSLYRRGSSSPGICQTPSR